MEGVGGVVVAELETGGDVDDVDILRSDPPHGAVLIVVSAGDTDSLCVGAGGGRGEL